MPGSNFEAPNTKTIPLENILDPNIEIEAMFQLPFSGNIVLGSERHCRFFVCNPLTCLPITPHVIPGKLKEIIELPDGRLICYSGGGHVAMFNSKVPLPDPFKARFASGRIKISTDGAYIGIHPLDRGLSIYESQNFTKICDIPLLEMDGQRYGVADFLFKGNELFVLYKNAALRVFINMNSLQITTTQQINISGRTIYSSKAFIALSTEDFLFYARANQQSADYSLFFFNSQTKKVSVFDTISSRNNTAKIVATPNGKTIYAFFPPMLSRGDSYGGSSELIKIDSCDGIYTSEMMEFPSDPQGVIVRKDGFMLALIKNKIHFYSTPERIYNETVTMLKESFPTPLASLIAQYSYFRPSPSESPKLSHKTTQKRKLTYETTEPAPTSTTPGSRMS